MADATTIDPSVQSKQTSKTRAGRQKAAKVDGVPSKPTEGEIPPAAPPPVAVAPKKRGRKPKQTATVTDNLPPQKNAIAVAIADDKSAVPKKRGRKPKQTAAVADNPPLPKDAITGTEGRNTHPGRRDGVQPTPRRSSQQVATERSHKQLELEEKLCIAEEAKDMLAQMELEDKRFEEGIEEECRIDEVDETEDDNNEDDDDDEGDDEDEGTGKAKVSPHPNTEDGVDHLPASQGKAKRKAGKALRTEFRKEINVKAAALRGARGQKNAKPKDGMARFSPADLNPTQHTTAGVAGTKTTMGRVISEVAIGGLDDTDIEVVRPITFGPIYSQHQPPTIPPGGPGLQLQRNHNRRNNVCPLRLLTTDSGNDVDTNHRPYVAQTKLKIRAAVQPQYRNPSMGLTNALGPEHFVLQRTWAKVFLPSLMYQFFISTGPFQDFINNSSPFVALVQEAFNATHPNVSYTVAAGDAIVTTVSYARILGTPQTERSLIASEALKHVKKYFEGDRFKDRPEDVKSHVWWALCPDGLAYQASPTPIDCPFDRKSPEYIPPKGRYQSDFIVPVIRKYIALAEGSAILPQLGAENPPIGLYIVVLVAVERAFKTFVKGTFKDPPQFSNENTWCSINDFRASLLHLDTERWDRILGALGASDVLGADPDVGLSTLSAYRGDLLSFTSPMKGSGNWK
ncbi:hypothetical protein H4582DRAFT_1823707 [Lactarius indigo]|nr:hypothetical protein H4582DRAFT_1823707 [Lactarius indigo]